MIQETTLSNGVRIVTDTISTVETATLGIWVRIGARNESAEINGTSHFLEHMAFKGTHRRNVQQIAEEIEEVGGYLNAFTSREMTAYQARILALDVPLALDIIADILCNSTFEEAEFERERQVIQQELLESLDAPDDLVFDRFQHIVYPDQPLGRPILGTQETLAALTPTSIRHYMNQLYAPNKMVLAVAGKISHEKVVAQAESLLGGVAPFATPALHPGVYKGGVQSHQKQLEQMQVVFGFQGIPLGHADFYTASVLTTLLGGGMSSRLFQEVREKRGLAYSISSFQSCYHDTGIFGIYAGTSAHLTSQLVDVVMEEVQKVQNGGNSGLKETELQRAKAQLKAGTLMGLESTSRRCEQAAQQTHVLGRVLDLKEIVDAIDAVNIADVVTVAGRIFSSAPTCVTLGPVDLSDQISSRLLQ